MFTNSVFLIKKKATLDVAKQYDGYLVLGRLWLYERKTAEDKSLSLPVPDHIPVRPQKSKSQCILLSRRSLEWECSVGKVRKVAAREEAKPAY